MIKTTPDKAAGRAPLSLRFHYAWMVLSICFLTTLTAAGVRSSPTVLIHPLELEFGWSRALIASAISMNLLLYGVAGPISGWLLDRYGARRVMMASLGLLVLGVTGTIVMRQFWQFFLVWGIVVGTGAGGVGSVLAATVGTRWFVAKRGLALGILGSASSTGQLVFIPLFMLMITYAGWRVGSMVLIVVAAVLLPVIFLFMRDDPSQIGMEAYGAGQPAVATTASASSLRGARSAEAMITLRQVFTTPTFWLLAGSFSICGSTAGGLIGTHLIPYEIDQGVPQVTAASVVGIMGGLNFVGTVLSGWMTDKVQPKKWLAGVFAMRSVSLLILPFVQDYRGLFVFAVIYGLDWFATVPPVMTITADSFGKQNIGKIYGWIFLAHQIGAAITATVAGILRTWLGNYQLAFLTGGVFAMIAAGLALQIKPIKQPEISSAPQASAAAGA